MPGFFMNIKRVILFSLVAFLAVVAYVQMMFVRGFTPVSVKQGKIDIELIPEGDVYFGGLYWGFLRFDLVDQLFVRVIGNIPPNQNIEIFLTKDGKTQSLLCQADKSGECFETVQRTDIRMEGNFTCLVKTAGHNFRCSGMFKRETKPIFLIHEAMMSV
jgi:hypothetical protein